METSIKCIVLMFMFSIVSTTTFYCQIAKQETEWNSRIKCQPELPGLEGHYNVKFSVLVKNTNLTIKVWISIFNGKRFIKNIRAQRHEMPSYNSTFFKIDKELDLKHGEHVEIRHKNLSPLFVKEYMNGVFVLTKSKMR